MKACHLLFLDETNFRINCYEEHVLSFDVGGVESERMSY